MLDALYCDVNPFPWEEIIDTDTRILPVNCFLVLAQYIQSHSNCHLTLADIREESVKDL